MSSVSDSTVTKLDFDLEPEPPPAPPRASSLGEIDASSELRVLDIPGQARHSNFSFYNSFFSKVIIVTKVYISIKITSMNYEFAFCFGGFYCFVLGFFLISKFSQGDEIEGI